MKKRKKATSTNKSLPDPVKVKISQLKLDPINPRLPEAAQNQSQDKLLTFMQREYDLLRLGRSIALHGFYPSEPLIVVKKGAQLIVVEGNRRLATLMTLKKLPNKNSDLQNFDDWRMFSQSKRIPDLVPAIVVGSREEVAPIIGYRHIAGIEKWEPWQQARFVVQLIDELKLNFEEVAEIVGQDPAEVKTDYRNYKATKQVGSLGIDTKPIEEDFSVLKRAMGSAPIREYIGIPAPKDVKKSEKPIPSGSEAKAKEVIDLVFGSNSVIKESRDITRLGKVISSKAGLQVLRKTRDLNEAEIASGGKRDRLVKRLTSALTNLDKSFEDIKKYRNDPEVNTLLSKCNAALTKLKKK